MLLISHRGNVDGIDESLENDPLYVTHAIHKGYDCEVDLWRLNDKYYLGHDEPKYEIDTNFLGLYSDHLWVHCKNMEALCYMNRWLYEDMNYFYHENDPFVLTSGNYIWTFSGTSLDHGVDKPYGGLIAVMPENHKYYDITNAYGICSDVVENYKYLNEHNHDN